MLLIQTDLAVVAAIDDLKGRLAALNPGASRHTVANGEIAPDALFGAALFDPSRNSVNIARWINESAYHPHSHNDRGHGHRDHEHDDHEHDDHEHDDHEHDDHEHDDHEHGEHEHDTTIRACRLTSDQPLSWDAVSSWLARLRKGAGNDLLRVRYSKPDRRERPGGHPRRAPRLHPPVQLEAWPHADRGSCSSPEASIAPTCKHAFSNTSPARAFDC
jgi:G3E family GTPase